MKMIYKTLLQLILFYPIFISVLFGQESETIRLVGRWGEISGNCNAVCTKGDTVFFNEGWGLKIVDFSDYSNPSTIKQVKLPNDKIVDIKIDKNYAYVLSNKYLSIIYIEDLANPIEICQYNINDAHRILLRNHYAYIVYGSCYEWECEGGLIILNISDPTNPIETYHYITEKPIYDIAISFNYLYLPVGNEMQVFNILNTINPSIVTSFQFSLNVTSLVVLYDYAYVSESFSGLHIINVSDLTNLTETGYLQISGLYSIHDLKISNDFLYAIHAFAGDGPDDSELLVINILDPANPILISRLNMGDFSTAKRIAFNNNLIYVAHGSSGLYNIDVSNESIPIEKGRYKTGYTHYIVVYNNYAYIGNGSSGMSIIDISYPENPMFVGSLDFKNHAADRTTKIAVDNKTICLVVDRYKDGCIGCESTIYIMDITEPSAPQVMGFYDTKEVMDLEVNNNNIYISGVFDFRIVDISDPTNPIEIGSFKKEGLGRDIALYEQYAFIADWYTGLRIIDISNIHNLKELSTYDDYCVGNVAVENNFAYIVAQSLVIPEYSLRILDVSDIINIKEIGYYDLQSYAKGIAVRDGYVYVGDDGLRIIDVTNPENPVEAGYFKTPGGVNDLVLNDKYIYVADGSDGLYIFQNDLSGSIINSINMKPQTITLFQNYPNPFNNQTVISFELPHPMIVNLSIYNVEGQLVKILFNEYKTSGIHTIRWDVENISSGVYFYRIKTTHYSCNKKCLLLR